MRDVLAAVHLDRWVLPALLVWPTIGSMLIFMFGRTPLPGREPGFAAWRDVRALTMITRIGEALLAIGLWIIYEPGAATWQAVVDLPWIPDWGIRFKIGMIPVLAACSAIGLIYGIVLTAN